jgi:hypothetical protein
VTTLADARRARATTRKRGYYDILAVSRDVAQKAKSELDDANRLAERATGKDRQGAQKAREAAQAAYDACFYRQWFEAITTGERQLIREAHPTQSAEERKTGALWSYFPALIAAMAVDVDADGNATRCIDKPGGSAEDWAADLSLWAEADLDGLWSVVNDVQGKPANDGLGKD